MSKQSVQIGEGHYFPLSYRVASAAVAPACNLKILQISFLRDKLYVK